MRYLPPDISYGIESSAELGDITGDVARFYYDFNDTNITDMVEALDTREFTWDGCHRRYADLYTSVYEKWFYSRATDPQRAWCICASADTFAQKIGERIDYIYSQYVSDALARSVDPNDLDEMRTYQMADPRINYMQATVTAHTIRANTINGSMITSGFINQAQLFIDCGLAQERSQAVDDCLRSIEALSPQYNRTMARRNRKAKIAMRKVLKKSSLFLTRLIGSKDATAFIRGEQIEVVGRHYTFRMKKRRILVVDHGGFDISVIKNATQKRMVNLCWYIPQTPALDQLAALIMAVKSGDELDIIEIGNHLSITQDAVDDEDFRKFLPDAHITTNTINGAIMVNQIASNIINTQTIEQIAFEDNDQMLRRTAGTTNFIRHNAHAYTEFYNMASKPINETRIELPEFQLMTANQVRQINGNILGDLIHHEGRDFENGVPMTVQPLALRHPVDHPDEMDWGPALAA